MQGLISRGRRPTMRYGDRRIASVLRLSNAPDILGVIHHDSLELLRKGLNAIIALSSHSLMRFARNQTRHQAIQHPPDQAADHQGNHRVERICPAAWIEFAERV